MAQEQKRPRDETRGRKNGGGALRLHLHLGLDWGKADLHPSVEGGGEFGDGGELLAGVVGILDPGDGALAGVGELGELGLAHAPGFPRFAD